MPRSATAKYELFITEPMGFKDVTELPGIRGVLGERLSRAGYDKAYVVLGKFLMLKKNKRLFMMWAQHICGANQKQAFDCYSCLNDWCKTFL
ncbi:Barrier-to-autointegration factor [Lamellibrachia satsuma]|nr:Barrier-to-autointegration factor [Lamellibrachia satsuma]